MRLNKCFTILRRTESKKEKQCLTEIVIFCNTINVYAVTSDVFNASLLKLKRLNVVYVEHVMLFLH